MCIMSIHCHHYYLPSHWLWPNKLTARTEEKTVSCPYRIDWRGKRQAVNSWRCNLPYCAPRTSSSGVNCFVLRAQWCEHVETFIVRLLSWFVGPWLDQVGSPTTNQTARLPAPETLRVTSVFTSESSKDSTSSSSPLGLWWCSVYETLLLSPPIRPNFGHALEPPP